MERSWSISSNPASSTTTAVGRAAELAVANWLQQRGHQILAQNWCIRGGELDVVSIFRGRIHVVEVKYRRSDRFGGGLDAITPQKLRRVQATTRSWLSQYPGSWSGYQIDAAVVSGYPKPTKINYILNIAQVG